MLQIDNVFELCLFDVDDGRCKALAQSPCGSLKVSRMVDLVFVAIAFCSSARHPMTELYTFSDRSGPCFVCFVSRLKNRRLGPND